MHADTGNRGRRRQLRCSEHNSSLRKNYGQVMRPGKGWNEEALIVSVLSTQRSANPLTFFSPFRKIPKLTILIQKEKNPKQT